MIPSVIEIRLSDCQAPQLLIVSDVYRLQAERQCLPEKPFSTTRMVPTFVRKRFFANHLLHTPKAMKEATFQIDKSLRAFYRTTMITNVPKGLSTIRSRKAPSFLIPSLIRSHI